MITPPPPCPYSSAPPERLMAAKGALGLWRMPEDAVRAIWEQIGGRP